MGLTSNAFLAMMSALAAGSVVWAAWSWPRLARQRLAPVAGRVGVLLTCLAAAIALALTTINDSVTWIASWPDLLGTGAQQILTPERADAAAARVTPVLITGTSIGTTYRPSAGRAQTSAASAGAVLRVEIRGEYTGIVSPTDYVYLPPQYFQPRYRRAKFPVILAFAGYPNDPLNEMRLLDLPAIAARLTGESHTNPAVLVMLNPSVALPRDTECTNVPAGPQALTFFGVDVPLALQRTFRVQAGGAGWAAIGYSTGAYCAVKLAMFYPGQLSAAVALAGYFNAVRDLTTGNLYGGSMGYRRENDLNWRLTHLPAPAISVLAATAGGERNLPDTVRFLHLIRPPMRGFMLMLRQGGHNYFTWRRMLPQSLEWLSQRLTPPAARP